MKSATAVSMLQALSICLIAKNEEHSLPRCLDSVRDLAGEILVVDTGSTDSTPQIAASYGARVLRFDFTFVDFSAARNYALAHAKGAWILMLDADEALEAEGKPEIESLVAASDNAGYFLERQNHSADAETTSDWVVRLFPNRPDYRYRGRVHETINASILSAGAQLAQTQIRIHHNFSSDREARRRKNFWYMKILNEELAADPSDYSRLDFLAAEYHQLQMFPEAAAIAERLAELRPLDARAHLFAGMYHLLYCPNLPQARADFERALKLRPGYPEAESFLRLLEGRSARQAT